MGDDDRPLSIGIALAWAFASGLVLMLAVRGIAIVRPAASIDLVTLGAIEAAVFLSFAFALLRVHAASRSARVALALRPTHPGLAALGLGLGLVLHVPAESLSQLVQRKWPVPEQVLANRALAYAGLTPLEIVALALVATCVVPLVEEVLFRGALFGTLRRSQSVAVAAVVSGIGWVITHLDLHKWLPTLLVAAVLGHLRAAGGSLVPCIALHVAFNTVSVASVLTGVSTASSPDTFPLPVTVGAWLATAALMMGVHWLSARSERAADARDEDEA